MAEEKKEISKLVAATKRLLQTDLAAMREGRKGQEEKSEGKIT
jgi:hypothetical protein